MRSRYQATRRTSALVRLEALEARDVPAFLSPGVFAAGVEQGDEPRVRLFDSRTGRGVGEVEAFDRSFRGGVRVAVGDVTGDGTPDLVVGAGSGGGPVIKIFDGTTGAEAFSFFAYEDVFRGGVFVAVGDINADDKLEILAGTGKGGGPRVRIFETIVDPAGAVTGVTPVADFFAFEPGFRGGVQVSAGDVDDDGFDDVITGTGVGGGPRVQVFGGGDRRELMNFFAFEPSFRNGVQVAAGDIDGDGDDDVIAGAGSGGGPRVRVVDGDDGRSLADFFAFDDAFRGGVRVGAVDSDGDGTAEILVGAGTGDAAFVRRFDTFGQFVSEFKAFLNDFRGGVQVGGDTGRGRRFVGPVTDVDVAAGTIDVATPTGVVVVRTDADTRVERNDVRATLADIAVGDRVRVRLDRDGVATRVQAFFPELGDVIDPVPRTRVEGIVTSVDADDRVVTILVRSGDVVRVELAAGAVIDGPGDAILTLADIAIGDRVEAVIGADGLATRLELSGRDGGGDDDDDDDRGRGNGRGGDDD